MILHQTNSLHSTIANQAQQYFILVAICDDRCLLSLITCLIRHFYELDMQKIIHPVSDL